MRVHFIDFLSSLLKFTFFFFLLFVCSESGGKFQIFLRLFCFLSSSLQDVSVFELLFNDLCLFSSLQLTEILYFVFCLEC